MPRTHGAPRGPLKRTITPMRTSILYTCVLLTYIALVCQGYPAVQFNMGAGRCWIGQVWFFSWTLSNGTTVPLPCCNQTFYGKYTDPTTSSSNPDMWPLNPDCSSYNLTWNSPGQPNTNIYQTVTDTAMLSWTINDQYIYSFGWILDSTFTPHFSEKKRTPCNDFSLDDSLLFDGFPCEPCTGFDGATPVTGCCGCLCRNGNCADKRDNDNMLPLAAYSEEYPTQ